MLHAHSSCLWSAASDVTFPALSVKLGEFLANQYTEMYEKVYRNEKSSLFKTLILLFFIFLVALMLL